ncbi:hypothetical protein LguiB_028057 [Lonicera macranthoides]
MGFLLKAAGNPTLLQQCMDKFAQKSDQKQIKIKQKRRLTMTPGGENIEDLISFATGSGEASDYINKYKKRLVNIEKEMETLLSCSSNIEPTDATEDSNALLIPRNEVNLDVVDENIWDELFTEYLKADQPEIEVDVEDLLSKSLVKEDNLQELLDEVLIGELELCDYATTLRQLLNLDSLREKPKVIPRVVESPQRRAHYVYLVFPVDYVFWVIEFPRLAEQVPCVTAYPMVSFSESSWTIDGHQPARVSPGVVPLGCHGSLYRCSPR